jgi:hypothetical protein
MMKSSTPAAITEARDYDSDNWECRADCHYCSCPETD